MSQAMLLPRLVVVNPDPDDAISDIGAAATKSESSTEARQVAKPTNRKQLPAEIRMMIIKLYLTNNLTTLLGTPLGATYTAFDLLTDANAIDAHYTHCNSLPLLTPQTLQAVLSDNIFRAGIAPRSHMLDIFLASTGYRGIVIDRPGQVQYLVATLGSVTLRRMELVYVKRLFFMLATHGALCACYSCVGALPGQQQQQQHHQEQHHQEQQQRAAPIPATQATPAATSTWHPDLPTTPAVLQLHDALQYLFLRADLVIQMPTLIDTEQRATHHDDPISGRTETYDLPAFAVHRGCLRNASFGFLRDRTVRQMLVLAGQRRSVVVRCREVVQERQVDKVVWRVDGWVCKIALRGV